MEEQKCFKSNFFVAMSERIGLLKKDGEKFSLTKFKALFATNFQIGIVVAGKKEKIFTLSFQKDLFYLENVEDQKVEGRPVFYEEDMINYLLILANGSQIPGKLLMPDYEGSRMKHLEKVVPS